MKKSLGTFVAIVSLIAAIGLTSSCKKTNPPVTCLSSVPDTAYVGQELLFVSCTKDAGSILWNFGDGRTAITDTARHTYSQPGTYSCSLTSSNVVGGSKYFTVVVFRPVNTWTFQGVTDSSTSATAVNDTIQTTNFSSSNTANISNLLFAFSAVPTADGTYQVVNAQFSTPGANQVAVYVSTPSGRNYGSTGNDNATATVTIKGGKVNIVLPSAMMVNVSNPNDSASLSATVTQTH
jgi:PKD repeat protein